MSARPVIQTYRLASLHEAAIARLKNPKNDRYKELYLQNRGIGEKVYNAVLSGRLDLACFCGDSSKYYSVLTRSTRQDGALQVTEIDRKGPIGHRLLTGPKQLELPGWSPPFPMSHGARNRKSSMPLDSRCNKV